MSENKGLETQINQNDSSKKGIKLIRLSAFCFSIISWYATSEGLSEFVFTSKWQAALASFAIQTILFVFNLKLPYYLGKIYSSSTEDNSTQNASEITEETEKEKNENHHLAYTVTFCFFYFILLLTSSFFSFVYICNTVVYEHQSGYTDDNTILASTYKEILNDTDLYIDEYIKASQLLASQTLSELQEEYPTPPGSTVSREELELKVESLTLEVDAKQENYDNLKLQRDNYLNSVSENGTMRNQRTYNWREDRYNTAYETAMENLATTNEALNTALTELQTAQQELATATSELNNYVEPSESIIADFLLEMLKPTPDPATLETYISNLNTSITTLGSNSNVVDNYAELVSSTQKLTIVIDDYTTLINFTSDENTDGLNTLKEYNLDNIKIPDPSKKSFESDYDSWCSNWFARLSQLENLIQQLPTFTDSENTKLDSDIVNVEFLKNYDINEKNKEISDLRRSKLSDMNAMERAHYLLKGNYRFTPRFSLLLAVAFDIYGLLAGIFIYAIQKKEQHKNNTIQKIS